LQTGGFRTAQVIPGTLSLNLMIMLGTLAPKIEFWVTPTLAERKFSQPLIASLLPGQHTCQIIPAPDGAQKCTNFTYNFFVPIF